MYLIIFILCFLLNAPAFSMDFPDISNMFLDALLCKISPVDARNKNIQILLDKYHVKYDNRDKDGLIDLTYEFKEPFEFKGAIISSIFYEGDSGSLFYAVASGDMRHFIKAMNAKPIPEESIEKYGWWKINGDYYKMTEIPTTEEVPFPPVILIGKGYKIKPGQFYFGCRQFDG